MNHAEHSGCFARYFAAVVLLVALPACGAEPVGADDWVPEPEMVVLPAGSFRMGDIQGGGDSDERPVHTVHIKSFAVGKYEVTKAQFLAFSDATGYRTRLCGTGASWRERRHGHREQDPVVCVNQGEARAYAAWLSSETGKRYRLLTESEWEYAARAGTDTRYHSGNSEESLRGHANCGEACADGFEQASPVGSFQPNKFGLYDMHGNVWEWVEDCWHDDYNGAPVDGSAWMASANKNIGVIRGGSWNNLDTGNLRAANRYWIVSGYGVSFIGFRVARDL